MLLHFLTYCIISNSSGYIATVVLPERFETLGECTALHKSEVRIKNFEYLKKKKKGVLQQFLSETENTIVNIYYWDYWEYFGDCITPETNLIYLLKQTNYKEKSQAMII